MRVALLAVTALLIAGTVAVAKDQKKPDKPKSATKPTPKAPAKPDPAKPNPPKPPAPNPVTSLDALGAMVELPAVSPAGKWSTLAKTTIPEADLVAVTLVGGDRCLGSGRKLITKELDGGRSWQCLAPLREGFDPIEIAQFRIDKGTLQFAWSTGATDYSGASLLRNGGLEVGAGTTAKVAALRKTLKAPVLELSYEEAVSEFIEIPDMPVLSSLRVEIQMPKPKYRGEAVEWRFVGDDFPQNTMKVGDDLVWAEAISINRLLVKIETAAGQHIKLTATPMFWSLDRDKPQRMTEKTLAAAVEHLKAAKKQLTDSRDKLPKVKEASPQRKVVDKQLAFVDGATADLTRMQDLIKRTGLGKINYNVLHEIERGYVVPLVTTK